MVGSNNEESELGFVRLREVRWSTRLDEIHENLNGIGLALKLPVCVWLVGR